MKRGLGSVVVYRAVVHHSVCIWGESHTSLRMDLKPSFPGNFHVLTNFAPNFSGIMSLFKVIHNVWPRKLISLVYKDIEVEEIKYVYIFYR